MTPVVAARAHQLPLRTGSAQACVTSPPYLQQRRYGAHTDELGLETTLDEYVAHLVAVLDDVRRVLRPEGLLWLNIGDKANGSGGAGGDWIPEPGRRRGGGPGRFRDPAYPDGSYLDVPGAVIRALLGAGWRLRLPIVWDKGRQAPEDLHHIGRPRWQHEMIYLLAPGPRRPRFYPSQLTETGSVWHFPPGGSGDPHLAPFPDELARRAIRASTLPGDLVIDPFHGSGTTGRVAHTLGRRYAGTDLYAAPGASSAVAKPAPSQVSEAPEQKLQGLMAKLEESVREAKGARQRQAGSDPCPACGFHCGLPVKTTIGRDQKVVAWHADEPSPYDAPIPGDDHPNHERGHLERYWACPHCGRAENTHNYRHRDDCDANNAHPDDCRCAWCTYGVTWTNGRCCTRGSHTVGPLYRHLVVCRVHSIQEAAVEPAEATP